MFTHKQKKEMQQQDLLKGLNNCLLESNKQCLLCIVHKIDTATLVPWIHFWNGNIIIEHKQKKFNTKEKLKTHIKQNTLYSIMNKHTF